MCLCIYIHTYLCISMYMWCFCPSVACHPLPCGNFDVFCQVRLCMREAYSRAGYVTFSAGLSELFADLLMHLRFSLIHIMLIAAYRGHIQKQLLILFSSLRLMRRPVLHFSSASWGTSWPSRNRNGQSKGSLEVLLGCLLVPFLEEINHI